MLCEFHLGMYYFNIRTEDKQTENKFNINFEVIFLT